VILVFLKIMICGKMEVNKTYRIIPALVLFMLVWTGMSVAQDVTFRGSAPGVVSVGQQFRVTYQVNEQGTGFRGPGFKGFTVLSGPAQSSNSSIQIINGSMTQSVNYSFTYFVQADKEGSYSIEPASITVQGKSYKSNAISVQVVKAQANQQQNQQNQQNQGNQRNQQNQQSASAGISGNDLFVKAILSKSEVTQGEHLLVTFKIYTKVNLVGFEDIKFPSFTGFWSSEIKLPEQISLKRENVNGVVYQVAELRKNILVPQKSGTLTIDPITVTSIVQVRSQGKRKTGDPFFDNFFNDPFFNNSVQNVKKEVKSQPVTIRVKPLPEAGKPADFAGAVGSFTLKANVDKTKVKANDAINLKVTVSGNGNLELIDKLNIEFPSDFEVYDPKLKDNIATTNAGVSGSRTFEYLIIPRNPGKYTINPVQLSFYNLGTKKYQTIAGPAFEIQVEKGTGSGSVTYSGVDKEEIKYLGSDIRFIKTNTGGLRALSYRFLGSWQYWLLLLLPVALFAAILVIWQKQIKLRSDVKLMKHRKATSVATKRLKKAHAHLIQKKEESFYEEISQAIWGYLSDKFGIPIATLSMETVNDKLRQNNVSTELSELFIGVLQSCEFARFAPGEKEEKMDKIYEQGKEAISKAERELR
jgi:hypothetical protein